METRTPSVNLLKTKGNNFVDKFISWALTIGRMVIILTETIALVAFLYRFILDRQIIDQRGNITQLGAVVKLYEKSEKDYRNLQNRLALTDMLGKQASAQVQLFTDIVNNAPRGIVFNSLNVSATTVHIDISVQSVAGLTGFVNKLKDNPRIASVSIDKIENKTLAATIAVGISAKLKVDPALAKSQSKVSQ